MNWKLHESFCGQCLNNSKKENTMKKLKKLCKNISKHRLQSLLKKYEEKEFNKPADLNCVP